MTLAPSRPSAFSNTFSYEINVKTPYDEESIVCSNGYGQMVNMIATPIYDNTPLKNFPMTLVLDNVSLEMRGLPSLLK